jgi:hypothetical protein
MLKTGFNPEIRGFDDRAYFIDRQATLREIVAQVFDGPNWIGDLNILSALEDRKFSRVICQHTQQRTNERNEKQEDDNEDGNNDKDAVTGTHYHKSTTHNSRSKERVPRHASYSDVFEEENIVQANCWEELLTDPLDGNCVAVSTSGNWLARLATAAISVQLGKQTFILPSDVCWVCVKSHVVGKKAVLIT